MNWVSEWLTIKEKHASKNFYCLFGQSNVICKCFFFVFDRLSDDLDQLLWYFTCPALELHLASTSRLQELQIARMLALKWAALLPIPDVLTINDKNVTETAKEKLFPVSLQKTSKKVNKVKFQTSVFLLVVFWWGLL